MEKVHDISIDEPTVAHQAILFMLDVLMRNDNQALSIAQLYDSFGDKSFSPQMLRAVGGNEQGLKQFLSRYPSLFTVMGDTVSANSGNSMRTTPERTTTYLKRNKSANNEDLAGSGGTQSEHDSKTMKEIEQEAIAFFKKQMTKREEDWLPIVSVAGHASQSSSDIRKFVGPQNEFKSFLQKYPHVFIVRDEYCGLKGRADQSVQPFPPPSPPPKRRLGGTGLNRTHSFKNRYSTGGSIANLMPNQNNGGSILNQPAQNNISNNSSGIAKPRLTPLEVKAVHYVMRILHKQNRLPLQTIPGLISRAPEHVSSIVGFTREDLIQFFKRHSAIFQLHPDGCVSVKQDAIKALILKDGSFCESSLFSGVGTILRLFPKYGILNLANNEQVFFDIQSCQFETFGDLTTVLKPTERLHFNAVIGPRDGSTKWRSLKTWINTQEIIGDHSVSSDAGKSDDSSTNGYSNNSLNDNNHHNYSHNTHFNNHSGNNSNLSQQQFGGNGQFQSANHNSNTNLLYAQLNNDEEFNQYQLDGEYNDNDSLQNECVNTNTNLTNTIKTSVSMNNVQQHQLQQQQQQQQSNQHNQQQQQQQIQQIQQQQQQNNGKSSDIDDDFHCLSISSSNSLPIITNANNGNNSISTNLTAASPSPTSFISSATSSSQLKLININTNTTQMIMKQASDNISKREICSNSRFVNMGCQTVSTGDIMTTNVYIE